MANVYELQKKWRKKQRWYRNVYECAYNETTKLTNDSFGKRCLW